MISFTKFDIEDELHQNLAKSCADVIYITTGNVVKFGNLVYTEPSDESAELYEITSYYVEPHGFCGETQILAQGVPFYLVKIIGD